MDGHKKALKEQKTKANGLQAAVQVGKNGITKESVEQISLLLKKKKLVKVRLLKSFAETHNNNEAAAELAERTGYEVVEIVGFVLTLWKR